MPDGGHEAKIYGESLEKEFQTEMLLSPWTCKFCVSAGVEVGSRLLGSATAIDLLFLVVFSYVSGQKVEQRNSDMQSFIFFNYF